MNNEYNPKTIEAQAQADWTAQRCFEADPKAGQEKFYCLSMLPYPSGELHMGHVRNYTIGDVISRYQHLLGKNVLQPMGWDAFGLPAENAAIKHTMPPAQWTYQNIEQMRAQLKQLGFAIDWRREITTCKPDYYRWEQWLFIKLFEKGLAYKKNAVVNWDPVDQTVLANEQVVNGRGWRSGALVEQKKIAQWFLKITAYADELLDELDNLNGWPEQVLSQQRHWIGRSHGVEIRFDLQSPPPDIHPKLSVFTTRADTLMGCSYLAIAAEHPIAQTLAKTQTEIADFIAQCKHLKVAEADRAKIAKAGLPTGLYVQHPLTQKPIPIWVANYVLMDYGSGAVMAVPAHDQRDFEFAQQYQLPIVPVIAAKDGHIHDYTQTALLDHGTLIDSGQFSGLDSHAAITAVADYLVKHGQGQIKTHYRLRDWGVSRQRYWGTPIPMITCPECGTVPALAEDLPVVLPETLTPSGQGSPLTDCTEFTQTTCPQCGNKALRETDTFDTFMESAWYYARYCCPDQTQAMLDERASFWTPVDQYIGGVEHSVMHLLYARFMHKVLRDEDLLNSNEPFKRLLTQGMVLKDGHKMSKSKGNTVSPQHLIEQYGADTVRLFIIFAAPPEQSLEWSDSGVEGSYRFLKRVWQFACRQQACIQKYQQTASNEFDWSNASKILRDHRREIHEILHQATLDMDRCQLNTVASAAMKCFNQLHSLNQHTDADEHLSRALLVEGMGILLRLLAPITPHICHVLWDTLGFKPTLLHSGWPPVDPQALTTEAIELMVQINGKLRARITVPSAADDAMIKQIACENATVARYLSEKTIRKTIVVPKRLINLVISE